ncbi:50S ribosomal protein L24 [Candidatus Saccharibacteria bacterium]|nr:50S ribosomal protein L24 [Candidatus Saccharibacteria bacterium]
MAQNLKSGDIVKVISGDEKGKSAKIVSIDKKAQKACLEGIGLVERHVKATYYNPKGGKKTIHVGIDLSNLKLEKSAPAPKKADKKAKKGDK